MKKTTAADLAYLRDTSNELMIQTGFVYENEAGEQRLVVSVDRWRDGAIVVWRTADRQLPKGAKSQGSATKASFRRWAKKSRKATDEDWNAFQHVESARMWRAKDAAAIKKYKAQIRADKTKKTGHL